MTFPAAGFYPVFHERCEGGYSSVQPRREEKRREEKRREEKRREEKRREEKRREEKRREEKRREEKRIPRKLWEASGKALGGLLERLWCPGGSRGVWEGLSPLISTTL